MIDFTISTNEIANTISKEDIVFNIDADQLNTTIENDEIIITIENTILPFSVDYTNFSFEITQIPINFTVDLSTNFANWGSVGGNLPDQTDLQTALDDKSDVGHSHNISEVTDLQTALDDKSDVGHSHNISEVTGLQTALDAKQPTLPNFTAGQVLFGDGDNVPSTSSNLFWDNTNSWLGFASTPTHPVTFGSTKWLTSSGGGIVGYSTADQTTNFQRFKISAGSNNVVAYNLEKGGTGNVGYHSWQISGSAVFEVDSTQGVLYGNLLIGPDNTKTLGRQSASAFRFSNAFFGGSVQAGAPANTAIAARFHGVGAGSTSATFGLAIHNSTGSNNALIVRDDGASSFGTTPVASQRLTLKAIANGQDVLRIHNLSDVLIAEYYSTAAGHGEMYIRNSASTTRVLLSSNGASYFTGGNLAINQTTATAQVDILSNKAIGGGLSQRILIDNAANQGAFGVDGTGAGGSTDKIYFGANGASNNGYVGSRGTLVLQTSYSDRLFINTSGNIGIGNGTGTPRSLLTLGGSGVAGVLSLSRSSDGTESGYITAGSAYMHIGGISGVTIGVNTTNGVLHATNGTWMGKASISNVTPTALVHIPAGTAAANTAPLKLTAGTNLTTPENGAFEFDGTLLYFTVGGVRKMVTLI